MKDRTKKLIKIGGLAAALALIGGTFAFTNIGQSVLNITEDTNRPEYGARVHDYFDDESGNKDVFFENFGQAPVFVRVQLKELFLRNGIPQNNYGENDPSIDATNPESWPVWHAEVDEFTEELTGARADVMKDASVEGDGSLMEPHTHFLNSFFHLNLGQAHDDGNPTRPWFMPTFNMIPENLTTAAAGSALDGVVRGATHPGEGRANFWGSGDVAYALRDDEDELIVSTDEREQHSTRQVLEQDRAPVSLEYWWNELMDTEDETGHYWVVDSEAGWAYWADALQGAAPGSAEGGEATSFFIDSKAPQEAGLNSIRVDWTYKLNVFGEWNQFTLNFVNEFTQDDDNEDIAPLIQKIWEAHHDDA
ncbi:hypothetical protein ACI1TH_01360 [Lactococcus petauri]|uniref:hypothetical protein n=1 Tax=Lactococcus petauri TaxID=1940789 RepID=UPI003854C66F